ncbi:thermonuclease family protein [Sulfurirhabdus autotrophica]|uniref:Endonuclease YncB(Thermonuclease family) n=1 Tax=Sulfurirhabdus autotrophica TaxID=1706046 RepID=A0A4R3YCD2_9PROT|nr:thermonuclease family protein [Sulfurirhabdus autotrophica]TCV89666.1 endonuclease YncB(thermonuclease family) [Sulfurirhabdus autotrophica]
MKFRFISPIFQLLVVIFGWAFFSYVQADSITGRVTKVLDGDQITIVDSAGKQYTVKIMGVDAPERYQPFGDKALQNLSVMVFNREVDVEKPMLDRNGLLLGKVMVAPHDSQCAQNSCQKTVDTGLEQIKAGLAWWFRTKEQSAEEGAQYGQAEFAAKIHRNGLWSETNPIPPWKWKY